MIDVLILEDEECTREFFKELLLSHPDISAVFDTSNAGEAIRLAKEHRPELFLLDIELCGQDMNGLEVAKQIYSQHPDSFLVFITGYYQYAIDSFAVHPYSYQIKPINVNDFNDLINEIVSKVETSRLASADHLVFRTKDGITHISKEHVIFVEKVNGRSLIHTYDGKHEIYRTLDELEQQLGNNFIRVHRSFIINLKHVSKVREIYDRSYEVHFNEYPELALMSRYHFKKYKKIFQI